MRSCRSAASSCATLRKRAAGKLPVSWAPKPESRNPFSDCEFAFQARGCVSAAVVRACGCTILPAGRMASRHGMIIEDEKDVTTAVLKELQRAPNGRFREIMSAFIRHLHA